MSSYDPTNIRSPYGSWGHHAAGSGTVAHVLSTVCSLSLYQPTMPTALGSAYRPTRASVLSSHIEGLIASLSVLAQWPPLYAAPQVLKPFALPCQISPPHNRADCVSQELPTYTPSQAAYVRRVRSH
jgi:hypothetical protein